jgi:hypothetical protein
MFSDFFSENHAVYEIMSNNVMGAKDDADNMAPARGTLVNKPTREHARSRLLHPHPHPHPHPHTHTHTHRETSNTYLFPRQQWFRERVSTLRCTYIACLV